MYLLGDLAEEEQQRFEEQLMVDDELADQLMLVEDELVDDYALGRLSERERKRFESHFLKAPDRKRKLIMAKRLTNYASNSDVGGEVKPRSKTQQLKWIRALFDPWWKSATLAIILLAAGLMTWRIFFTTQPVNEALVALNQAYQNGRPVEPRITGFSYAELRFSERRGNSAEKNDELKIDYVALDRAKNFLFGANGNSSDPAVLHVLGKYYLTQKEFDKAIYLFGKALVSEPKNAQLHSDLGAAVLARIERDRSLKGERSNEDVEECLKQLNEALRLEPSLQEALFNRALLYQGERLQREALDDWKKYRELDPNSPWGKEALDHLQEIEKSLKKVSRRNELLYQDFTQAQQNGDEVKALEIFGLSYSYNGNHIIEKLVDGFLDAKLNGGPNEAKEKLRALSKIGRLSESGTGDKFTADLARYYQEASPKQLTLVKRAREIMSEANNLYGGSKNDAAIEKYEQARKLFEEAGTTCEALFAEARIGMCHHQRSDTEQILRVFLRLAPINLERKYLWMEANAYCGLANGDNASGRFSEAIDDCLKCEELSKRVGDQIGLIRSLILRAGFYRDLGKHDEALRLSQQGLDLSDRFSAEPRYAIGFYQTSSRSLSNIGLFEAARAFQSEAIKMAEEDKSPRLIARAHIHLGLIYGKWKKYNEAISSLQRGIAIGGGLGNDETGQELAHYGLLYLGNVYREAGEFNEALKAFDQIIGFFRRSGREIYLYAGSKGRLLTFIAQKNDPAAEAELDRVINLYEKYRRSIQEESNRNRFFDQEQGVYDIAIDFAYSRLENPKRALGYSELCRARSLLDASRHGWKMIDGPEAPDLRIDAGIVPADPDEIQRRMPNRVQMVEYAVVDDKLLIWLISKTRIESRQVKISRADLTDRVKQYLEMVSQPPIRGEERRQERSAELYDILVRPIEGLLDRRKQLCIIPDKILGRLPFETLIIRKSDERGPDKLLLNEFQTLYTSSANMFLGLTEKARQKSEVQQERLLAVGNPDFFQGDFPNLSKLPSARREAATVATYYKSPTLLVDSQARKNDVIREMERSDVVHLALHYETNSRSPMLSRMPMASTVSGDPDRALYMHDLYRRQSLRPRLVVLSACQTGAEDYLGGEGVIGISRPFEAAGIPLVIASLWPVDTDATSDLMIEFHRRRKEGKLPTVEALRSAQQTIFGRKDKYRHPYYWAAFIAVGGYSEY